MNKRHDYIDVPALAWCLLPALLAFIALVVIASLVGCCPKLVPPPPVVTEHVVTVPVIEKCATEPLPVFRSIPRPSLCAPKVVCWSVEDASALADNVERLQEWSARTAALCAPPASQPSRSAP